ncbi:hypothetical protein D0Z07_6854 [Hyphodiscus hymeniophilus]|uniref:Uncharacterized protein n=1 Tax=Hyphodiscus hymeniophilus TaxID=353542 RepID=A0A9P7AVM4_9HELO|nr:hypothetical protein D0Z07_6854 [Hyphodiscus hymeniophilus]
MDEASRLVSELQQKLSDLDHKVWQYRRDMASEFTKYTEDVLRDVPEDVSETVSKAIAESVRSCKSLNPDALSSVDSCVPGTSSLANRDEDGALSYFANSSHTIPYQREDRESESPQSPHEREKEFQGLFTPSYLPLLDSTSPRNERRSSYESQPSPSSETRGKEREMEPSHADASTDTRSLQPSPEFRRPATPKRKNTDEWSVASDVSDGPVRRSALRRMSSTSKGTSPRRVRFDFEGEEVLPTSSPLPTQSILSDVSPTPFDTNSDEEAGSEQVEDIDDIPPKRISSSQALRALSRGPLEDDGTLWTTVSAPPDGSASVPAVSGVDAGNSEEDLSFGAKKPSLNLKAHATPMVIPEKASMDNKQGSTSQIGVDFNDSETLSDDEMLDMPPLKSMKGQKAPAAVQSPVASLKTDKDTSPEAVISPPSKPHLALDDFISKQADMGEEFQFLEDQEMFPFDENNEIDGRRSLLEEEHVDTDPDSPDSPVSLAGREGVSMSGYSKSPAQEISRPAAPRQSVASSKGVVGSYKGRPFSMPIVSDEIHAQAASLGAMNSFVGSLDGRSGLDESDMQSFRASGGVGSFSGTPRSMSERMAMEDLLEAEEGKQNDTNGN